LKYSIFANAYLALQMYHFDQQCSSANTQTKQSTPIVCFRCNRTSSDMGAVWLAVNVVVPVCRQLLEFSTLPVLSWVFVDWSTIAVAG
jgi:hypothetical protein